ncbi:uracil-DNA glycosylase [Mycoplasmopsis iners]|uniref:uracil-DNA glycosylase n=1 Tax=Mycoplasmopsis iners TaxID=76630 RepID=UPI0004962281|nr:uracil-DNA glycosylase [Mycoplasmopsis iners]
MKSSYQKFHNIELKKDYFKQLMAFLEQELKTKQIFPEKKNWYRALDFCEIKDLKVIILGQDPYYSKNYADGLAFSSNKNCPRSLENIIDLVKRDYPGSVIETFKLDSWAQQGILLLNTVLTVEENKPKSHKNKGWELYVANLIQYIFENNSDVILVLWGNEALNFIKKFSPNLPINKLKTIFTSHPSPLSYKKGANPFYSSNCFKKINSMLSEEKQIDFSLRKDRLC